MALEAEKRIAELKEQIEKAKQLKYRYEARLEELQQRRQQVLAELAKLEVAPEDLKSEIQWLQHEVDRLLKEASFLLPADLLRG